MFGEIAIVGVINSVITQHKIDRWCKLIVSSIFTGFCTGTGVFGAAVVAHLSAGQRPGLAVAYASGEACIAVAGVTAFAWQYSDLTKGMTLSIPSSVEQAEHAILEQQGITTIPGGH